MRTTYFHLSLEEIKKARLKELGGSEWVGEDTWQCLIHKSHMPKTRNICWHSNCKSSLPKISFQEQERRKARALRLKEKAKQAKLENLKTLQNDEEPLKREPFIEKGAPLIQVSKDSKSIKKRGSVETQCGYCNKTLWRKPSDIKRSKSGVFYCSPEHRKLMMPCKINAKPIPKKKISQSKGPKRRGSVQTQCGYCNKTLWRKPSDIKRSKSGVFFCNANHQKAWKDARKNEDQKEKRKLNKEALIKTLSPPAAMQSSENL